MHRWIGMAAGMAMLGVGLAASTPAFADSGSGCPPEVGHLTIDYVNYKAEFPGSLLGPGTLTVKVSGLVTPKPDLLGNPFVLKLFKGQVGHFSGAPGTPGSTGWDAWENISSHYTSGTETVQSKVYDFQSQDVLNVVEANIGGCPLATASSYVPLTPLPYAQLPEVPWAAGLPALGLGAAAMWWRRRATH